VQAQEVEYPLDMRPTIAGGGAGDSRRPSPTTRRAAGSGEERQIAIRGAAGVASAVARGGAGAGGRISVGYGECRGTLGGLQRRGKLRGDATPVGEKTACSCWSSLAVERRWCGCHDELGQFALVAGYGVGVALEPLGGLQMCGKLRGGTTPVGEKTACSCWSSLAVGRGWCGCHDELGQFALMAGCGTGRPLGQ
jgi:hypothetical protein